jgi:hypothetical protein
MAVGYREVPLITVKRRHIKLQKHAADKYGHWWFELGPPDATTESYGWWPKKPVRLTGTFGGVPGDLNGKYWNGTETMDAHHGDEAEEEFHPYVSADDKRTDDEIVDCLRQFAKSYSGSWQWVFEFGQNCHSFQRDALNHCGLIEP